jgi:hypothetical protein
METAQSEKKPKLAAKKPTFTALRVRRELKRQIETDLERLNKKDLGRRIRAEDYLWLALSLITPQHFQTLQETSLTHADRLERDFRDYAAEHGTTSRDEYLGKRLTGEIPPPKPRGSTPFSGENEAKLV